MVAQMPQHNVKWLSPSPMWEAFGDLTNDESRKYFNRPTILRFKNDNFMDELLALMSHYPDRLAEWQAQPETWRKPMATPKTAAKLSLAEPLSQLSKRQTRERLKGKNSEQTALSVDDAAPASYLIEQTAENPLKLYQPVQQRFYLVAASLVCRRAGLPDRAVDSGKQQQTGFVLRRLIHRTGDTNKTPDLCDLAGCDEYALVQTEEGQQWRNITQHPELEEQWLAPDEERLPMFTIGFTDMENRNRKLRSGFIPVGKREAYLAVPKFDEEAAEKAAQESADTTKLSDHKKEAIKQLFELQVAGPWKGMIAQVENEKQNAAKWSKNPPPIMSEFGDPPEPEVSGEKSRLKSSREQIQTLSWYVLVDLVQFLYDYLNDVYKVFNGEISRDDLKNDAQKKLYDELVSIHLSSPLIDKLVPTVSPLSPQETYHTKDKVKQNLKEVIEVIIGDLDIAVKLDAVDVPYDRNPLDDNKTPTNTPVDSRWPNFLFPLADPIETGPLPNVTDIPADVSGEPNISHYKVDQLTKWIKNALLSVDHEAPEVVTFKEAQLDNRDSWFVIRCIHEQPNCGPFFPAVLSEPTEPFKMASFFDPDAPGRPIRIPMPPDISPAGLRKYSKNASFLISDMLCGKIRDIRKITFGDLVLSVLPWPFHKDLPEPDEPGPCGKPGNTFGLFCSLSIPIVTLCALILLIIMVTLFDIFFKWLPLLFSCFSLPGLKGKKE